MQSKEEHDNTFCFQCENVIGSRFVGATRLRISSCHEPRVQDCGIRFKTWNHRKGRHLNETV